MDYIEEIKGLKEQMTFLEDIEFPESVRNIVMAGMGGSGIAGKIFQEIYTKKPVALTDSYSIPDFVNEDTLFIGVSYSGNTEETLAATNLAMKRGARVSAITSGGKLGETVKDAVIIPKGLQPRSAIGYLLNPVLVGAGFDVSNFNETREVLSRMDEDRREFEQIAAEIGQYRKTPVVYGTPPFSTIAYRIKTQFNENSKIISYWSYFPELNHNDTVALENDYRKDEFYFMVLRSSFTSEEVARRIKVTSDLCKIKFREISAEGYSLISQLYSLIHKGDYISYYLAKLRNIDPRDVSIIERLKKELSNVDTNK